MGEAPHEVGGRDTMQSSTTLSRLANVTPRFFQHRVTTKDGAGDWRRVLGFSLA